MVNQYYAPWHSTGVLCSEMASETNPYPVEFKPDLGVPWLCCVSAVHQHLLATFLEWSMVCHEANKANKVPQWYKNPCMTVWYNTQTQKKVDVLI